MAFDDVPLPIRRALAVFEFFRRIGFPSEAIDLYVTEDQESTGVLLMWKGREFRTEHALEGSDIVWRGRLATLFAETVQAWASGELPDAVGCNWYQESILFLNLLPGLMSMKGIIPPCTVNCEAP